MVGYAGVATALLRLCDQHRYPYQLSLDGFRSGTDVTAPRLHLSADA